MSEVLITIKQERKMKLPSLPNFIRSMSDESVAVENLTDEQLREIGKQWTEELVRHAGNRRIRKNRAINKKLRGE